MLEYVARAGPCKPGAHQYLKGSEARRSCARHKFVTCGTWIVWLLGDAPHVLGFLSTLIFVLCILIVGPPCAFLKQIYSHRAFCHTTNYTHRPPQTWLCTRIPHEPIHPHASKLRHKTHSQLWTLTTGACRAAAKNVAPSWATLQHPPISTSAPEQNHNPASRASR